MKRIDRLIVGELFGPWCFGVAIFTVLIVAGTYLFKITDYVVKGIDMGTITKLTLLFLPGAMAKTFPMAVLLAALLAFGRLSGDSEVVAMKAAGISLVRIMVPVAAFGLAVSILALAFNELVVPRAAYLAKGLQDEITAKLDGSSARPTSYPIYDGGRMTAQVQARDFSIAERTLRGVTITVYDKAGKAEWILLANRMVFELNKGKLDPNDGWSLENGATLLSADGMHVMKIADKVWPTQVPHLQATDEDIVATNLKDLDAFSMADMAKRIRELQASHAPKNQIANLQYGYWNKLALPLAALVYALVGAPLGVRNHRSGAATGFWLSVIIIFGYMMLANFMAIWAQGGAIPAWVASFLPLMIGVVVAGVTIHRKNV